MELTPGDYQRLWDTMIISNPAGTKDLVIRIHANFQRYQSVSAKTGVPVPVIGILHYREGNLSFFTHLANGDPLTERTVHEPAGLPAIGTAPFTWEQGAEAALFHEKFQLSQWHTLPAILQSLEAFNGLGYQKYHSAETLSPYLWSGTNHYTRGKYDEDGHFNPVLVDRQEGVAVLYRYLTDKTLGIVS